MKFLILFYLLNIIAVVAAFGFLGLIILLVLSLGAYKVLTAKLEVKKKWPEKVMFLVAYFMGIVAVHNIFGAPELTIIALVLNMAVFMIFLNVND